MSTYSVDEPILWVVIRGDIYWTDKLKDEEACVEHIKDSIKAYPESVESDYSYRKMTLSDHARYS